MEAALHGQSKKHSGSRWVERQILFAWLFMCAACGAATTTEAPKSTSPDPTSTAQSSAEQATEARDVAQIHRAKCGACHLRVEPGLRTRAELEAAFPRHRKRVRLSEDEWSRMIDYLAAK